MHFRLPKPLNGWREFVGEVGIIVVGVLIALGGEQVVVEVQWRQKVADTTKQLNDEVHSNARSAYRWLSVHQCLDAQLNSIDDAVGAARASRTIVPVAAYTPPLEVFLNDAWLNARSLQVADHIKSKAMRNYAILYFLPPELQTDVVQLHQLAAELQPLTKGEEEVTSAEAGDYQRVIGKIRELQDRTELGETLLLKDGERLGVRLSNGEKKGLVREARTWAGPCASAPDLDRKFAPGDQTIKKL